MSWISGSMSSSTRTSVVPISRISRNQEKQSKMSGRSTMTLLGASPFHPLSTSQQEANDVPHRRRGSIYGSFAGIGEKRSTVSSAAGSDDDKRASTAAGHGETLGQTSNQGHVPVGGRATVSPTVHSPFDWKGPTPVNPEGTRSLTPFSGRFGRYSSMAKRLSRAPTILPRDGPVTHAALIASAERIFARYLVPGAEKEIYLPPSLRIHSFILSSENPPPIGGQAPGQSREEYEMEQAAMAQVPDMFHAQKEYVFGAMEQDAFPRFLRAKAFGNLTPVSALVRLVVGLLVLWIGLSTGFALIFLDVKPKSKRFFVSSCLFFFTD